MIGVGGLFHAYPLARQLRNNSIDYRVVTSYYKKLDLDPDKVDIHPYLAYLPFALRKFQLDGVLKIQRIKSSLLEYYIRRKFREYRPDISQIFAGYALSTFKEQEKYGSVRVLDRGSSHAEFQYDIMKEEHKLQGLAFRNIDKHQINEQLKEYKFADHIIVPSKFVHDSFTERGDLDKDKLILIPYGVDLDRFRGKRKESRKFRLLFVGNNAIRKGVHYILQAFSELNLPNSEVVFVGRIKSDVERFLKKYPGNYRFLGHVSENEIRKLFLTSSAYILPSLEEGSALSTYEAMAAGLPQIVSTNTGSMARDGKEGFVVPIRDVKALKEKIRYLYENPDERKRMGRSAKRYVRNFTWDEYGKNIIKAYKRMLR